MDQQLPESRRASSQPGAPGGSARTRPVGQPPPRGAQLQPARRALLARSYPARPRPVLVAAPGLPPRPRASAGGRAARRGRRRRGGGGAEGRSARAFIAAAGAPRPHSTQPGGPDSGGSPGIWLLSVSVSTLPPRARSRLAHRSGFGSVYSRDVASRREGRPLRGSGLSVSSLASGAPSLGRAGAVCAEPRLRSPSLAGLSSQPLDYHVCSLDPRSLPRWVRAPPRRLPLRRGEEAGASPRAALSLQVSVCCCRSPRAAREPVSCGVPGRQGWAPARRWEEQRAGW